MFTEQNVSLPIVQYVRSWKQIEVGRQEPYAVKAGTTTTALPPIQMHCATIIAPVLHWLCSVRVAPLSVNELKPVAGVGIRYSVSPPQTGHL